MAARRPGIRRRSNKVPINFVSQSRNHKPGFIVRKAVKAINISTDESTQPGTVSDHEPTGDCGEDEDMFPSGEDTSTEHTRRKEKMAEKWNDLRCSVTKVMVEGFSLPEAICSRCYTKANVRCVQCGPCAYYCEECGASAHRSSLFHHVPEVWKGGCFVPLELPTPEIQPEHACETQVTRFVTCFHIEGAPRKLKMRFCHCEPDTLTLIRLHYWPGTPSRPSIAFSFALMDWMEVLLLECQVSVQDFTLALEEIIKEKFGESPCNIYPVVIDAFEEYRFHKGEIRLLSGICESEAVTCCPACPKANSGPLTISLDGNFGLCRKKAAGASIHDPLSQGSMFLKQSSVDQFVANYKYTTTVQECSDFLAGNTLRSSTRYARLDETGIMGAACRHEYPLCFINLRHGERISYSVYLLTQLRHKFPDHHIQLMYDVACTLRKHLESTGQRDLLERTDFAVPIFHAYGHKLDCQVQFNPRNLPGFGLSDGEVLERLWSYLRRFSSMTKEMRPSHRIDVLSDALRYCARKSARNVCQLLTRRYRHAQNLQKEAASKLQETTQESPVPFTEEDITVWAEEETANLGRRSNQSDLTSKIWSLARERWHCLRLKSKYADGQKIAIRLSRRITTVTKQLKTYLSKHNARCPVASQLSWEDVSKLSDQSGSHSAYTESDVPNNLKYQAVRLRHQSARASEEITRLQSEMKNCVDHYTSKHEYLVRTLQRLQESSATDAYAMGSISLLMQHIKQSEVDLCRLQLLVPHVELPLLVTALASSTETNTRYSTLPQASPLTHEVPYAPTSIRVPEEQPVSTDVSESSEEELDCETQSGEEVVIPLEVGSHTHPTSTSGIFVPRRDLPYRKRRMTSSSESEKEEARDLSSGDPVQESAETSATDRVNYTSSGESSDDDMEIQAWRGNRFLREEFIRSQPTGDLLTAEERELLQRIKVGTVTSCGSIPRGFLSRPPQVLKKMLRLADRDSNRMNTVEALSKGPYFRSRSDSTSQ